MPKFNLVALFSLTIISTLHTSFAIKKHGVLHQYNEIFALFGDLDNEMGTSSQEIFVQNANNGNNPNRGAIAAGKALQRHAVVQEYYRNNDPLRTAVVDEIQQFRLQLEFPPAIPVRRRSESGSSSGGGGSSSGSSSTGGTLRRMGGSRSMNLSRMGQ